MPRGRRGLRLGGKYADGGRNLVNDLAGVIRSRIGGERREQGAFDEGETAFATDDEFVAKVRATEAGAGPEAGAVSIDAIGAAVAASFAGRELSPGPAAVPAVAGALLMAMATANEQTPPLYLGAHPEQVEAVPIQAPWQVSHPVLLDPIVWMISTACTE